MSKDKLKMTEKNCSKNITIKVLTDTVSPKKIYDKNTLSDYMRKIVKDITSVYAKSDIEIK